MPKKNYFKIPSTISNKIKRLGKPQLMIGCVLQVSDQDLAAGKYQHLSLPFRGQETASEIIPPANSGKYSHRNVNGEEIVRRDLPKETHYNYVEAPNWGDDYNGTHEVALPYERYPRDFVPPQNTTLKIELMSRANGWTVFKFLVNEVVKATDDKRLLSCINLLQENVGSVDVFPSDYNFAQYTETLQVAWEILPPGERDRILQRISAGRAVSAEKQGRIEDRYNFLHSLKPKGILVGTSGMQRYLGGMLKDDLVVFENVEYGNAIYVMYDDWKELSKRSRVELLSGRFGKNFDRVVHTSGWKGRVKKFIEEAGKN